MCEGGDPMGSERLERLEAENASLRAALEEATAHRKRVEAALADAKVGIWLHDLKKDVLVHSRVDGETNPIRCIERGMFPSESPRVIEAYRKALADPSYRYDVEFRALEPYGEHWRLARGKLLYDADGNADWFVGASVDVTAVRHREEQLEIATKLSRVYVWSFELEDGALAPAKATFVNVWESLGYETPEGNVDFATAMGRVVLAEDQPGVMRAIMACLDGKVATFEHEYRIRHADGSIHWNLGRGIVVRDLQGKPLRFLGTSVDVTDLKRVEEEALRNKERLELALNGSRACTWDFEPKDGVLVDGTSWFANLVELAGHDREPDDDFLSLHERIIPPEDQDPFVTRVQAFLDGDGTHYEDMVRVTHKNGSERWHLARGLVVRDPYTGLARRLIGTSVDITEQKRLEVEVQRARERAEAANREKDEFLAHVSHELRTPMNAILAMTELAAATPHSEHQAQLLATAQSAASNLVGIIDDLLDFSKITAGKLSLDLGELSLRATIGELIRALSPRAERKGLVLACEIAPDVPDAFLADEGRLRQVLMNLVGNAIKFTTHGKVTLAIGMEDDAIRFTISDTGIGIAIEHQRSIFGAFVQGDPSTTRKYGGTGLGLTIATQLVELMGGAITLASEPGQGSAFSFRVALERGDEGARPRVEVPVIAGRRAEPIPPRVLVAEDNDLNIAVLRELLEQRGYPADFARDGREAWECAKADAHDLLLLDLHMPEMDGFEVVRAIRARERERGGHLPVIALTARSSAKDRELSLEAGMDDFLSKPIKVNALWTAVDRALDRYPPKPRPAGGLVDRATIVRVCGGRAVVFDRLRSVFRDSLPGQMARGRAALDDHDFGRLLDAAHRLHGTLATFSSVAGAVALRLEDAANAKEVTRCRDLVGELEAMCAALLDETKNLAFDDVAQ